MKLILGHNRKPNAQQWFCEIWALRLNLKFVLYL